VKKIVSEILAWFAANARDLPWRRTLDPYGIWVSEVMLQQTQVKTVTPYWERWMREFPNLQALANAPLDRVLKMWEGLGYYSRARNLHRAAQHITEFPRDFDSVLALPGVGRYTAGAICSVAFNHPVPVLDGNVARVVARMFAIRKDPKSPAAMKQFWKIAQELVTEASRQKFSARSGSMLKIAGPCSAINQGLMELGAMACKPQNPLCDTCPLARVCLAYKHGDPEAFPRKTERPEITAKHFLVLVLARGQRFLVRQRPAGVVNSGFWEFPNFELPGDPVQRKQAAAKILKRCPQALPMAATYKQSITRYRIHLEPYLLVAGRKALIGKDASLRWLSVREMAQLPFAGAHRKILRDLSR
jgi:A/G-specific adenine glycosylase